MKRRMTGLFRVERKRSRPVYLDRSKDNWFNHEKRISQIFCFEFVPNETWNSCFCIFQLGNLSCMRLEYFQPWLGMRLRRCDDLHRSPVIHFVSFLIRNLVCMLFLSNHRFELDNENTLVTHLDGQQNRMKQNWIALDGIHHSRKCWYYPCP